MPTDRLMQIQALVDADMDKRLLSQTSEPDDGATRVLHELGVFRLIHWGFSSTDSLFLSFVSFLIGTVSMFGSGVFSFQDGSPFRGGIFTGSSLLFLIVSVLCARRAYRDGVQTALQLYALAVRNKINRTAFALRNRERSL